MKRLTSIVLLVFVAFVLVSCNGSEVLYLQNLLATAEKRIAYLEQQEFQYHKNDYAIYLRDTNNFVADGIVSLGNQYEVYESYQILDSQGNEHTEYVYKLNGSVGLLDNSTLEWIDIEAVSGETIHLITYRYDNNPEEIAYYTCYTNSINCTAITIETGIFTGN